MEILGNPWTSGIPPEPDTPPDLPYPSMPGNRIPDLAPKPPTGYGQIPSQGIEGRGHVLKRFDIGPGYPIGGHRQNFRPVAGAAPSDAPKTEPGSLDLGGLPPTTPGRIPDLAPKTPTSGYRPIPSQGVEGSGQITKGFEIGPNYPNMSGKGYRENFRPVADQGDASQVRARGMDLTGKDLDAVTRTMLGEVGPNASPAAQASVASVIRNRMAKGGFGSSPHEIVHAPSQFEPWSKPPSASNYPGNYDANSPAYKQAESLAKGVFNGVVKDQTQGSTHFVSPSGQAALGRSMPSWAKGDPLAQIGGHNFYAPEGRVTAEHIAGLPATSGSDTGGLQAFTGEGRSVSAPGGMTAGMSQAQLGELLAGMSQNQGGGQGHGVNLLGQLLFGRQGIMGMLPPSIQQHGIFGGLGSASLYPISRPAQQDAPPAPPPVAAPPPPVMPQTPIPAPPGATMGGGINIGNGPVTPGQTDPHQPGFDPNSVPFLNKLSALSAGDLTKGMQTERNYYTNPLHAIPPGSPEMPKSLAPLPDRHFPQGQDPADLAKMSLLAQLFAGGGGGAGGSGGIGSMLGGGGGMGGLLGGLGSLLGGLV